MHHYHVLRWLVHNYTRCQMPINCNVYVEEHKSAESFLQSLDLQGWTVDGSWSSDWIFRGQRDANWDLTPTAWRKVRTVPLDQLARVKREVEAQFESRIREHFHRQPSKRNANVEYVVNAYAQARAEFSLIWDFVALADQRGYRVPSIDTYQRLASHDYLPDLNNYPLVRLLPEMNSAAALAQHHGVPTRYLDWTRNPFYAAFFAASEIEPSQMSGSIAVWALRPDLLRELGRANQYNSDFTRFSCATMPHSDNPYLLSQEAVFVGPAYGCAHIARTGQFPRLEAFALAIQADCSSPVIRKLTLPHSEAGELLRRLWLKGISRAHLMPTLDNVTHALGLRWRWA
jgi:FRG domain.